ncbi:MAG: hypothetical protein ACREPI_11740 [Candidatus Dormibacterales bacterium]
MKAEPGEPLKPRAQYVEEAVQMAIAGRWDEAAELNRFVLDQFGLEIPRQQVEESNNRLGKALTELGKLKEARAAYEATLQLNPLNVIARKNVSKLGSLLSAKGEVRTGPTRVDLNLFVEEMGKTVTTTLGDVTDRDVCAKVAPGDVAELSIEGDSIVAETVRGVRLGTVEAKLARRLIKFIQGGNRYQAATTSCEGATVRLIIRETHQDPKFAGKPSFPMRRKREVEFRPYAKGEAYAPDMDDFESESSQDVDEGGSELEEMEGMHEVGEESGIGDFGEESEAEPDDFEEG